MDINSPRRDYHKYSWEKGESSSSTQSNARTRLGWNTGIWCLIAASLTGVYCILPPRPLGLSGCVTARTTSCPA